MSWPLLLLLTALALLISWHAIRKREAYGLYRFLAFESLALQLAWNVQRWYRDPWSIRQLISWALLALATALAVHGFILLRRVGGARQRLIEDTQELVEVGAYRYIRHPLYASLLFAGWGIFLKGFDWQSALLALAVTAFLWGAARSEERFNLERFGGRYAQYMQHTKRFIPFVI